MKKIVSSFIASIALVSALNAADFYATVDGEQITKQDISMALQDPRIDFDKLPDNAKKQVLEQIINRKLLAKKAIKDGIEKDPQYVETINKIKEDLAFQVWQKNQIDKIKFTEDEKKDFYEKNKAKFVMPETLEASHILVKTEKEAFDIIKQLDKASNKEEKFKELAKTKSQDPAGKNGGYLGKFPADQMVPEFSSAAKAMSKGTYSKVPTKTQFGYHVIYLKDKIPSKALAYNEVEGNISQILLGNSYNKKVKELTDELRKDAKIVIK
ncbi:MAG: peptidyl-prolyl cis-trans isomerase [Arcobacter sp.]|uniref:peptidylprolyl isomerase n=1 Tax=Arcobacter sp. TaxID=1872629 RepID=UPI003D044076